MKAREEWHGSEATPAGWRGEAPRSSEPGEVYARPEDPHVCGVPGTEADAARVQRNYDAQMADRGWSEQHGTPQDKGVPIPMQGGPDGEAK